VFMFKWARIVVAQNRKSRKRFVDDASGSTDHHLVDVAPLPVLARLQGLHDWMLAFLEVLGRVLVLRAVAAADVAAGEAHAQLDPAIALLQAFRAALALRLDRPDLSFVRAFHFHLAYANETPWIESGSARTGLPSIARIAFASAGAITGVAGSPTPDGFSFDETMKVSIRGISLMRSTG